MIIRCESIALNLLICALLAAVPIDAQRRGECCQEYCYDLDNERPQSAHFATKTSYLIAKGPETGRQYLVPSKCYLVFCACVFAFLHQFLFDNNGLHRFSIYFFLCFLRISDCNPTKIWIYARHGTRLPKSKFKSGDFYFLKMTFSYDGSIYFHEIDLIHSGTNYTIESIGGSKGRDHWKLWEAAFKTGHRCHVRIGFRSVETMALESVCVWFFLLMRFIHKTFALAATYVLYVFFRNITSQYSEYLTVQGKMACCICTDSLNGKCLHFLTIFSSIFRLGGAEIFGHPIPASVPKHFGKYLW